MTSGEQRFVEFQNGDGGTFYSRLFETLLCADHNNLDKLARGFPEEVAAIRNYRGNSGYWTELVAEWRKDHG